MKAIRTFGAAFLIATAGIVIPVAVSRAQGGGSGAPNSSATSSAAPAAAGSASASGSSSGGKKRLPRFAEDLPPDEKSKAPTSAEWNAATSFRFDRPLFDECGSIRVREWVRVVCHGLGASIGLVAGSAEGYQAAVNPSSNPAQDSAAQYFVQFPMRRGERRLISMRRTGRGDYDGGLYATDTIFLSAMWNDGEEPFLITQGSR